MAKETNISLRNQIIYQVFVRQHSKDGNFQGVINDLDRIKDLGVDILYLLPIHPIGKKARKGNAGSPYSIVDYYQVHEDLGTLEDFKQLVMEARKRNLKVMIDIVFNHTSRDSILVSKHPDWFYKNSDGSFANRVGDWSDITDLDFSKKEVWKYLIDCLVYWAKLVDGFRCDVAPLLPLDFWMEARKEVSKVNKDLIWLTESVHISFVKYIRDLGYDAMSDSQMYQVFDICYDYDIFDYMNDYLENPKLLKRYLEEVYRQEGIYPKNYVKLRSFENHDQKRLRSKTRSLDHFKQMNALMFFLRGTSFLYAGQEEGIDKMPDLFEVDLVPWNNDQFKLKDFFKALTKIKKHELFKAGIFDLHEKEDIAILSYHDNKNFMLGVFNLENLNETRVPLVDGTYKNEINQKMINVLDGHIKLDNEPIIILTTKDDKR